MKKLSALLVVFAFLFSNANAAIINSLPYNLTNGSLADATQVMANYNQIVNNVNTNAAHNGANNDITSLTGLTTPLAPIYGGASIYVGGTTSGTANAQTLASVTPSAFALTAGNIVTGIAGFTNTGATTLQVNGQTATAVEKRTATGLIALVGGEIVSGSGYVFYYDGTQFELINPSTNQFTTEATLASATSTDLGTASSHVIDITGTTTITSFGSSAVVTDPLYFGRFTGILTLTNNNTSLILPGAANITTAAGDTFTAKYEGSGNWRVLSYTPKSGLPITPGVVTIDTQKITSTGTYTPCAGLLYADVKILAAGGGSGGTGGSGSGGYAGGGGGAGGLSCSIISAASIGSSQTVTINAGGTAGAAANGGSGIGGTGGTTTFGALLTANGGAGGYGANNTSAAGGTGGSGTCYGVTTQGAIGATGNLFGSSGAGASTFLGGGGAPVANNGSSYTVGNIGVANSGGGASGSNAGGGSGGIGAVGGTGVAIITEYCN